MSVTALIGTNAQFHCAGTGIVITWEVDGIASIDPSITSRGITTVVSSSSGTVQSNLTVPGTSMNNGTTVRCRLFSSSGSIFSNYSTLTVLPGESSYGDIMIITDNIERNDRLSVGHTITATVNWGSRYK